MDAILIKLTRISRILFRCIPPSIALSLFLVSHRSHRFAQISSLQATVVTMPHSNRYFSARELRISFGTRIARITRICCLVSKDSSDSRDSCSKINTQYYFLSRTRISRISRIFFVASNDSYITKTASLLYYCIWCITINLD